MQRLVNKINEKIQQVFQKAEDKLEQERDYTLSQNLLNATLQNYVTDKVSALQDLHADLYDDWARLYATIDYKGVKANLSVDLKLRQMIINSDIQLLVFEQISNTQVISSAFDHPVKKIACNFFIYFYHHILKKDPLGMILERLHVVDVKPDGLLYLDLHQYLIKSERAMRHLKKVRVNHGIFQPNTIVVSANLNLVEILRWNSSTNLLMTPEEYEEVEEELLYRAENS